MSADNNRRWTIEDEKQFLRETRKRRRDGLTWNADHKAVTSFEDFAEKYLLALESRSTGWAGGNLREGDRLELGNYIGQLLRPRPARQPTADMSPDFPTGEAA